MKYIWILFLMLFHLTLNLGLVAQTEEESTPHVLVEEEILSQYSSCQGLLDQETRKTGKKRALQQRHIVNNSANIMQAGSDNRCSIKQTDGNQNRAGIIQIGQNNISDLDQLGNRNKYRLLVHGNNNETTGLQQGNNNVLDLKLNTNGAELETRQLGNNNVLQSSGRSGLPMLIEQKGNHMNLQIK